MQDRVEPWLARDAGSRDEAKRAGRKQRRATLHPDPGRWGREMVGAKLHVSLDFWAGTRASRGEATPDQDENGTGGLCRGRARDGPGRSARVHERGGDAGPARHAHRQSVRPQNVLPALTEVVGAKPPLALVYSIRG